MQYLHTTYIKNLLNLFHPPGRVPFLSQPLHSSASSRKSPDHLGLSLAAGAGPASQSLLLKPFRVTCKLCKLSSLLGCETKFLPQSFCFKSLLFEFFFFLHFFLQILPMHPQFINSKFASN